MPSSTTIVPVRFTLDDAQRAADEWGCNCGPGAVAGILGLTLDEVRPHLGDFEQKRYTNPTLMWSILRSLGAKFRLNPDPCIPFGEDTGTPWPDYGLARVQWEGPWTGPGVPMRARYRHTHWVGARWTDDGCREIFDINCMCVGGWVAVGEWSSSVVPWLLKECEPKADGGWHLTHSVEVSLV